MTRVASPFIAQMETDLRAAEASGGLGHNNARQKIQYHLRLKQELEEMRCECTSLLKERFKLEQCIRCAAGPRSSLDGWNVA